MVKRGILLLAASALAPAPLSAQTVEDRARHARLCLEVFLQGAAMKVG